MADLASRGGTLAVLRKYQFTSRKRYGQNFLVDPEILARIMEASGITEEDFVLEVGPGIGTMTQALCGRAREVVAVEIDGALLPILGDTLAACRNVEVIHGDILKMDISQAFHGRNNGAPIKVVANLPYYITTPIVMRLLESRAPIGNITVMVQKEVADRMRSGPGSKDYGSLSLAVQYYAEPRVAAEAPPESFLPRPKVGSAVVHLEKRPEPPVRTRDEEWMFRIIRASFGQRRKTLPNSLSNAPGLSLGKEQVGAALEAMGLEPGIRGEALTLAQFARLSDLLHP